MSHRGKILTVCSLVGLLFVLYAGTVFSQVVTGSILGRVTDNSGAVVPGATVQLQNAETGFSQSVQTDVEGRYLSRNLPLGTYTVTVQQAGFRTEVHRGVGVSVGSEVTVNVELAVGNVQETVDVTAEAPIIETTNATLSALVSADQVRELPLNGRNLDQLTLLNPGVFYNRAIQGTPSTGTGIRLSVNGARPDSNLYLLDGTVVNEHGGRGRGSATGASLGVESILEFRMLLHNFAAEYGRNSGAVISSVTRSGGNELHGSVYEFLRNNVFDARNFFNPGDLPAYRRNQFGAAVGGRIIKDRLFFFANYEGLRERQGQSLIFSVPDLNARNGIVPCRIITSNQPAACVSNPAGSGLLPTFNPLAVPYLNLYPAPNYTNNGDGTAQYVTNFGHQGTEDYAMERMDWRITDKDNFYWRYVYNPSSILDPPTNTPPNFLQPSTDVAHFVVLSETHIFSGASLNEFRAGFMRTDPAQDSFPATDLPPSLSFVPGQEFGTIEYNLTGTGGAGQLAALGTARTSPQHFAQNIFQESDNFSITRGAHSLKFGADAQRIQINLFQGSYSRGDYLFGGLTDLMSGRSSRFSYLLLDQNSTQSRGWRNNMFGFFAQDDYRMRSNLTLNLGLRYEFQTAPGEVNGKSGNLRSPLDTKNTPGPVFVPQKTNFSPRFGLAWDPTGSGKTSVRFGAGLYYNQITGRLWYHVADQNADFLKSFQIGTAAAPPPFPYGLVNGIPLTATQANWTMDYRPATPVVVNYNFDIQRQLAPSLSLRVGYVGSYGWHFTRWSSENLRTATILPDGVTKFYPSSAPLTNRAFGDIGEVRADAVFLSNGMQIVLQKTLSAGLQFQASYSLSLTTSDADETGSLPGFSIPGTAQDSMRMGLDHSLSAYDQRHTFVMNGVYQMPWDKHLSGRLAKTALGGWAVNGIFAFNTGTPMTILSGYNSSANTDRYAPDRPNLVAGASNNPTSGVTAGCGSIPAGQKLGTPDRWYDPCALVLPPNSAVINGQVVAGGFYGNLGRNTMIGPGLVNLDFTFVKNTPLTERKKLEFRAEIFNIFNHANFGPPNLNAFNSSRQWSGNAGVITFTSVANRQIQLGLKLIF